MRDKTSIGVVIGLGVILAALIYLYVAFGAAGARNTPAMRNAAPAVTSKTGATLSGAHFSLTLPSGWQSVTPLSGVDAMAEDPHEHLTDPAAVTAHFKSYIAVKNDSLAGTTFAKYDNSVTAQLKQLDPQAALSHKNATAIGGHVADTLEATMSANGLALHILMALIAGSHNDVWIVSCNTIQSMWSAYRAGCYRAANSFTVK